MNMKRKTAILAAVIAVLVAASGAVWLTLCREVMLFSADARGAQAAYADFSRGIHFSAPFSRGELSEFGRYLGPCRRVRHAGKDQVFLRMTVADGEGRTRDLLFLDAGRAPCVVLAGDCCFRTSRGAAEVRQYLERRYAVKPQSGAP